MNKIKLLALTALTALALTVPAHAALFDNNPSGTVKKAIPGAVNDRGYTRSRLATTNSGIPSPITNGVNALVTNVIYEVPFLYAFGGSAPGVSFLTSFSSGTISNATYYFDVSLTGTNDADFTSDAPVRLQLAGTTGGRRSFTTIAAATLGGARYIKWTSVSNDAVAGTAIVNLTVTNGVFGARHAPSN